MLGVCVRVHVVHARANTYTCIHFKVFNTDTCTQHAYVHVCVCVCVCVEHVFNFFV